MSNKQVRKKKLEKRTEKFSFAMTKTEALPIQYLIDRDAEVNVSVLCRKAIMYAFSHGFDINN